MPKIRSIHILRRILITVLGCLLALGGWLIAAPAAPVSAANTQHVTSCTDTGVSGDGSLRGEIAAAGVGDTIVFNQDCTGATAITLTAGTLTLTQGVTIDGTGHTVIVDGNNNGSVFTVNSGVTASISFLTIQHGNADFGGGINNNGILTVTNSTLSGNSANIAGGALENNSGTLTVTGSTLSGNNSGGRGGGIENTTGTLTVTNSTLSGNSARFGGGIYTFCGLSSCTGSTTVTSSTLSGNSASVVGGGVDLDVNGMTLTNSIIANSTAGGDCFLFGTLTADSHNLADDGSCTGATQKTSAQIALVPLGSYGGPTQTMALGPGSAAIDQGATVGSGPAGPNPPTNTVPALDQRGKSRIGTPDIGTFESQGFTLTGTSGDGQTTVISQPFASPLVATLSETGGSPLPGGTVTFIAPGIGASATLGTPNPATTDANGRASVIAAANGTPGAYTVTASAPGASPATFALTNFGGLSGISPASGGTAGGNTVTLTGAGFGTSTTTTHVIVDGAAVPAANITSVTDTRITYIAPAHAAGSVVVTLTVYGVPLAGSAAYTYGVVNALPGGQPTGGTPGSANPLPGSRPTGTTVVPAPNPLPAARP